MAKVQLNESEQAILASASAVFRALIDEFDIKHNQLNTAARSAVDLAIYMARRIENHPQVED